MINLEVIIMYLIKKSMLKIVAFMLSLIAITTVNSSCAIMFGQPKEADSLKRFKKE